MKAKLRLNLEKDMKKERERLRERLREEKLEETKKEVQRRKTEKNIDTKKWKEEIKKIKNRNKVKNVQKNDIILEEDNYIQMENLARNENQNNDSNEDIVEVKLNEKSDEKNEKKEEPKFVEEELKVLKLEAEKEIIDPKDKMELEVNKNLKDLIELSNKIEGKIITEMMEKGKVLKEKTKALREKKQPRYNPTYQEFIDDSEAFLLGITKKSCNEKKKENEICLKMKKKCFLNY